MTLTLTTTREATVDELEDLIYGTGALTWSWWGGARHTPAGYEFHHDADGDVDGACTGRTWRSHRQILRAAGRFLSEGRGGEDASEAISESLGYLDAADADVVLQYAVFGEVVFG